MARNELKYEDRNTAKAKIAKMQDYRPEAYIFMIWGASFISSPVKFVKFFARNPWIIFFVFCAIRKFFFEPKLFTRIVAAMVIRTINVIA
jgi:hypothetical protein